MSGEIVHARDLDRGFDEGCDVVVVGSGAGGAVVATHLAEAGHRVIVLEEGPHYTPDEVASFTPSQAMRKMWREGGMLTAMGIGSTPMIAITVGRNVGGSSVHTGGVCFRIPDHIHHAWVHEHGLDELSAKHLERAYEDVEKRCHVVEVPEEARSESTRRLVAGAEKLGISFHPMRRNTIDCEGNGVCNFGCPKKAKQSVDLAYLPKAIAKGARLYSDTLVERVLLERDRAVGVEGWTLKAGPKPNVKAHRFRVRANAVVAACGSLHTPMLLMASGLAARHLGHNLTLHPSTRISAMFDDPVNGWDGALQAVFSEHFHRDNITLVGVYTAVNVLAGGLPGVGPAHRKIVERMPNLAVMGGLVHDSPGGVVRMPPGGREPILTYEMAPQDLLSVRRTMTILGEIAFAAGAREIFVPVFGTPGFRDVASLRRFEHEPIDPRRVECMSFHPLGSARMANDPRRGVTTPSGEVYGVRGLYVADGSILPTSIGVNSQVPIMAMATRIAWLLGERLVESRPKKKTPVAEA